MCMICQKQDDFSIQHLEMEVKKLRREQVIAHAQEIKKSISAYEKWLVGDRLDGWETHAVMNTIEYLKRAQYILSRKM